MKAEELKSIQEPIKKSYREDPMLARVVFQVTGVIDLARVACRIVKGESAQGDNVSPSPAYGPDFIDAGLHPAAGGSGALACSAEMLIESLVACAGVTFAAVATAMSIPIRTASIVAQGEMDFRGTLGVDKTVPIGLQSIRLEYHVETEASAEQLATLLKLTDRYCVIMQTITKGVAVESKLSVQ